MHHLFFAWRTRMLSLLRFVLLVIGFVATLKSGALAQTWSTTDLKTQQPLPSGMSNSVTWQVGNYMSGGAPGAGVYYGRPKECSAFSMPWMNYPAPAYNGPPALFPPDGGRGGMWSTPTLLVYSGLDHVAIMGKAWPEVTSFVNGVAQPGGWHASLPSTFIQLDSE
jgi:hypothetical protein